MSGAAPIPPALPRVPGAYVLLIALDAPLRLAISTLPAVTLEPGRYAYCGSARGPGGIAARVGRHVRRGKAVRWHVDRLTEAGRVVALHLRPEGDECALFQGLRALPGTRVPVPGFGSSDCRRCPTHLLALPATLDLSALGQVYAITS